MLYRYFLFISMSLYAIGFFWLVYIGDYHLGDPKVSEHLSSYIYFVVGLVLGGLALLPFRPKTVQKNQLGSIQLSTIMIAHKLTNAVGLLACVFSIYYVVDGGYEKILLLGTNIEALEFRFLGLGDRSRWLSLPMELSRRILLPFAILAKMSLNRFTPNSSNKALIFLVLVFMSVSVVNLDRGPILMFIVLMAYQMLTVSRSIIFRAMLGLSTIVVIGFTGALFTFLQYNKLDFQFQNLLETVDGILVNRIVLSPVKMSQVWVFDRWSQFVDPLYLEFSRVSILWGGNYVGSHEGVSYLIAPVGVIGDIYRNLGTSSMFYVGFVVGLLFLTIERRIQRVPEIIKTPMNFLALILAMYLYYGNIFSLGPWAIFFVLMVAPSAISIVFGTGSQKRMYRNQNINSAGI